MDVRFYAGIGDILAMESHWSPEFRASVRKAYIRPYQFPLVSIFKACKQTKHIRFIAADYADYDERAEDWNFVPRFHWIRSEHIPFQGSSLLRNRLCDVRRFKLPRPYMVIQTQTTLNPQNIREIRDMPTDEWTGVLYELDHRGVHGVVVNSETANRPPGHPRIVDLIGATSFAESAEILKGASGYIGIDSWLAILAAQLFDADHLRIRAAHWWTIQNQGLYYRPHSRFDFVVPSLIPHLTLL